LKSGRTWFGKNSFYRLVEQYFSRWAIIAPVSITTSKPKRCKVLTAVAEDGLGYQQYQLFPEFRHQLHDPGSLPAALQLLTVAMVVDQFQIINQRCVPIWTNLSGNNSLNATTSDQLRVHQHWC